MIGFKKYLFSFTILFILISGAQSALPLEENDFNFLYDSSGPCDIKHSRTPVIIVGAGPAGLTLAAILKTYNIEFRIIETKDHQTKYSKATGLHQTTLKLFKKLGILNKILDLAVDLEGNNLYVDKTKVNYIKFYQGNATYDKNISLDQFILESILLDKLIEQETFVEFSKELIHLQEDNDKVSVVVYDKKTHLYEIVDANFVVGADGTRSIIRKILNIPYEGTSSNTINFTFDCEIKEHHINHNEMYQFVSKKNRLVIVPIVGDQRFKFSGNIETLKDEDLSAINNGVSSAEEFSTVLREIITERASVTLACAFPENLSFYRTGMKIAEKFSTARTFLIGDAAHTFFPAGGYGLNSSIEDAFSLGWRIAFLINNKIKNSLIDTYNLERKQNALFIAEDSLKKRSYTMYEHLVQQLAKTGLDKVEDQKETQIYTKKSKKNNSNNFQIGRLENFIPTNLLEQIKNSKGALWEQLNTNLNFNIVLAYVNDYVKKDITNFIEEINEISNVQFNIILIEKELDNKANEDLHLVDSEENLKTLFDEKDGLCFIIRPDNFLEKIIVIPNDLNKWKEIFCNYFLFDLNFKIQCINIPYSMDFITLLTAKNIDSTKQFYECLDLEFVPEKHKNGPEHYSYSWKDSLLEIYPETSVKKDKTTFIITVKNIEHSLKNIVNYGGKILDDSNINAKNKRATIEDPDGRIIQIFEKS